MRRLFRISFLSVMFCVLGLSVGRAADKPEALVGGRVASDEVRVFTKDSVYKIYNRFVIAGTLIIEPGTLVKFAPNGRLIDSTGGRIIADGYAHTTYHEFPEKLGSSGVFINPLQSDLTDASLKWANYGTMGYFLYPNTIKDSTVKEKTVNSAKADYVFNVVLDTATRVMRSANGKLAFNGTNGYTGLSASEFVISYQQAIMFANSGIATWKDTDKPYSAWERANYDESINIRPEQIRFVGQSTNNFTREKGHIVIMPGARAAFFRDCSFENMRKDTTVDFTDYYANNPELNNKMIKLTNGKGGAITTFSSRTWLLDCEFRNNFARNAAGAVQVLQAPSANYILNPGDRQNAEDKYNLLVNYPPFKNPALTEPTGKSSIFNNSLKRTDNLDESLEYELLTDEQRQAYDDARLSVFLGRMRNLTFEKNTAKLSGVKFETVGSIIIDADAEDAAYPQHYGNYAKGGAVLIAGRDEAVNSTNSNLIEVGLGVNSKVNIKTATGTEEINFYPYEVKKEIGSIYKSKKQDNVVFNTNKASNLQFDPNSLGSMGGALYLGANTSLIVAANFMSNEAETPRMIDTTEYAKGGAIYQEGNSYGRLQLRGDTNIAIVYNKNKALKGGAVYVASSINAEVMSPVIGGSDMTPTTRDYGKSLVFDENEAKTLGGAIYTERNMRINGAGGMLGSKLLYSNGYRITFKNNTANYAGGAIAVNLPDNDLLKSSTNNKMRNIHIARAIFNNNKVGNNVASGKEHKVIGGGALFTKYADLNVIKGVEFTENSVMNGNGAAIHVGAPSPFSKKFFVSDLDEILPTPTDVSGNDIPTGVNSVNEPFTKGTADVRMLTRFINNKAEATYEGLNSNGNGATQLESGTVVTKKNINAITFLDSDNGFAVGDQGTIIKLSQAGDVWEYQNYSNTTNNLTSIYFTTDRIGFIGGDQGLILRTDDAGNTWNVVSTSGASANINAISFINSNVGVAVCNAGKVLKTTNGGLTWTEVSTVTANKLNDVAFTGINKGLAIGDRGTILATEDGGSTWAALNNNYLRMYNLESIYFTDATTGYIAGNGVVLKTINSGQTWSESYRNNNKNYTKIVFTGLETGYAYDADGTLVKTINGGSNWTEEKVYIKDSTVALASRVNDAYYLNQNTALIASQGGLMFRTVNNGKMWNRILASDTARESMYRFHPSLNIAENGIGLGGAIYIVDSTSSRNGNDDVFRFNRVRFEKNTAVSGAAIYSDNFNLKLALTRSLAVGNKATSQIGIDQNAITGPAFVNDTTLKIKVNGNQASSDLAGAIFYGELSGPEPYEVSSYAANSLYGNDARFLIRLPDAPNSKGALAGRRPGPSGIDTLRGNYWGKTEANVTLFVNNTQNPGYAFDKMSTFFVDKCDTNYLSYVFGKEGSVDTLHQGPFETNGFYITNGSTTKENKIRYEYSAIAIRNENDKVSQTKADSNTIPEKFLMSGRIYDLYDKGTDIKVADYSNRRMSPIEDFAVGIPPVVKPNINDKADKYLIRWTRDPEVANDTNYKMIGALQAQWAPDVDKLTNDTKGYYHPIGWPLFIEAKVDYSGDNNVNNQDPLMINESVFYVINETTLDFIRVSAKQLDSINETFRARVELVPDLSVRENNGASRRAAENLLALPNGKIDVVFRNYLKNAEFEDAAALQGRKYYGPNTKLGSTDASISNNLFVNRNWFAPSNIKNGTSNATFFAGERYTALPVNVGDIVSVVSRTVLYRQDVDAATKGGLRFEITNSTKAPVFTGDVEKLKVQSKDSIFNNVVYLTEDRQYPCPDPSNLYSNMGDAAGRDRILNVTGFDYNKFYDPRSVMDSTKNWYSSLDYKMIVDPSTLASKWLFSTVYPATHGTKDSAIGYMELRGTPMNPYIVPGGEIVKVRIENFAPSVRTQDWMENGGLFGKNDTLSKFMYIYPPYFHTPNYDVAEDTLRARYLQQDTIFNTANYFAEYQFRIFVVDSTPRFIPNFVGNSRVQPHPYFQGYNNYNAQDTAKGISSSVNYNEMRVVYVPTKYRNGLAEMTNDGKIIANLTDKLRLQADFNTDDEAEDYWATVADNNFNFRYGRTAYGFNNVAVVGKDTTVIDIPNQSRPSWMNNSNIYQYNSESSTDEYAKDFTINGKLNIRVNGEIARKNLGVDSTYANSNTLDTVFTVVANDGHSGMTVMPVDVYVNVAPQIKNMNLPNAVEGTDYNPSLTDTTRMVKIYDPNQDQEHRYELLYKNDPRLTLAKDLAFTEAGFHKLSEKATTPNWLKINPMTGMLYGKPDVNSISSDTNKVDSVTVIVWDKINQRYSAPNFKAIKSDGTDFYAVGENGAAVKINPATSTYEYLNFDVANVSTFDLNDIAYPTEGTGYIVGNHGLILKKDGSNPWVKSLDTAFKEFNFKTVDFVDPLNGIIAGDKNSGFIIKTSDGGTTWKEITHKFDGIVTNGNITKVKMIDANTILAGTAQGKCYVSTDAGVTTKVVSLAANATEVVDIYKVADNNILLLTTNSIYQSVNKGDSWSELYSFPGLGTTKFTSIGSFETNNSELTSTKSTVIYVTGQSGICLKSIDGLNSFLRDSNDSRFDYLYQNINDLVMYKPNVGYMIGDNGTIIRFTDTTTTVVQRNLDGSVIKKANGTDSVIVYNVKSIGNIGTRGDDMLSEVRTFPIKVRSISHKPEVSTIVRAECFEIGKSFIDSLFITDNDFRRINSTEKVSISIVNDPTNSWSVTPSQAGASDTLKDGPNKGKVKVVLTYTNNGGNVQNVNGKLFVEVLVKDQKGNEVIVPFSFKYTDTPDFTSQVTVSNYKGHTQVLEWGTAVNKVNSPVTTGDGIDGEGIALGNLDDNYCEYEIPPVPNSMVFDARWNIPTRTGTVRNIQPRSKAGVQNCDKFTYRATFQSGGNDPSSSTGDFVPLTISWIPKVIPSTNDVNINPIGASFYMQDANSQGNLFNVNMRDTKEASKMSDVIFIPSKNSNGDSVFTIQLSRLTTKGFNIVYTCEDLVNVNDNDIQTGIHSVGPNPVVNASKVTFGVSNYSNVKLELYDAIGNLVNTIANSDFAPGVHTVDFDANDFSGNNLATGSYTIRMVSGTEVSTYQVKVVR